ncbi:hypothetical protein Dtox_4076 [Desulfofarcimen acetoxidans DSM 771]|uniref:Uncharacterized protein n=2 Tax=Desulfofarcimen acetoxidans TaxID=58138 RepID=C8VYN0_DESAS|nr:hypothetical protein Dtox_4076 [Desulfofarcimen acetoxidans DSM 771]
MENNILPITTNMEGDMEAYFIATGFIDLLPLAIKLARQVGYGKGEIIEAICKVSDKFKIYPPTRNRTAWFRKVFVEKLDEARADIVRRNYLQNR